MNIFDLPLLRSWFDRHRKLGKLTGVRAKKEGSICI